MECAILGAEMLLDNCPELYRSQAGLVCGAINILSIVARKWCADPALGAFSAPQMVHTHLGALQQHLMEGGSIMPACGIAAVKKRLRECLVKRRDLLKDESSDEELVENMRRACAWRNIGGREASIRQIWELARCWAAYDKRLASVLAQTMTTDEFGQNKRRYTELDYINFDGFTRLHFTGDQRASTGDDAWQFANQPEWDNRLKGPPNFRLTSIISSDRLNVPKMEIRFCTNSAVKDYFLHGGATNTGIWKRMWESTAHYQRKWEFNADNVGEYCNRVAAEFKAALPADRRAGHLLVVLCDEASYHVPLARHDVGAGVLVMPLVKPTALCQANDWHLHEPLSRLWSEFTANLGASGESLAESFRRASIESSGWLNLVKSGWRQLEPGENPQGAPRLKRRYWKNLRTVIKKSLLHCIFLLSGSRTLPARVLYDSALIVDMQGARADGWSMGSGGVDLYDLTHHLDATEQACKEMQMAEALQEEYMDARFLNHKGFKLI